ncbi:MAG: XrtA-associated ATPase [Porphyrobacter sp.]|jgi:putative secretion ATPase (PEP-CTERM system associated)|nr:XrtA-associated ATPase [Porphyrobacter sp.]
MYEQFYGLAARAFQLTPDPQFYFESASHKRALSYLGYGLNQGEGFIVITGEVGAGKSTLVAHLMEKVDPAALSVAQIVTTALDGAGLVHMVAEAFGLAADGLDKAGVLSAIERFLQDEARAGRRALLIVDECQNLDLAALEELRMLSNFQLGAHPLLQSLLLGQPEFRRTLAHHPALEQLRQRVIASHHLEGLDAGEIDHYVSHRLAQVGWTGSNPAFAPDLMPAVFAATGGIPRRVNQVMNRLLLLGAIEEQVVLSCTMLAAVMAEMSADQARGAAPQPSPLSIEPEAPEAPEVPLPVTPLAAVPEPVAPAPHAPLDLAAAENIAARMAERDERTAELEAAIRELQAAGGGQAAAGNEATPLAAPNPALMDSLAQIEARLEEQEQSLRHVLAMLIEWLEGDAARKAA